jgi:hypothetical protein
MVGLLTHLKGTPISRGEVDRGRADTLSGEVPQIHRTIAARLAMQGAGG